MSWRNGIVFFVLACLFGMYEATVATFFRGYGAFVLPVLPFIVMCVVRERIPFAVTFAGVSGFMLDALSPEVSTFATGRLILIAVCLIFVSRTVLTNQSMYTALVMMLAARLLDRAWVMICSWLRGWMPFPELLNRSWNAAWHIMVADMVIVIVVFTVLTLVTQRFVVRNAYVNPYV